MAVCVINRFILDFCEYFVCFHFVTHVMSVCGNKVVFSRKLWRSQIYSFLRRSNFEVQTTSCHTNHKKTLKLCGSVKWIQFNPWKVFYLISWTKWRRTNLTFHSATLASTTDTWICRIYLYLVQHSCYMIYKTQKHFNKV